MELRDRLLPCSLGLVPVLVAAWLPLGGACSSSSDAAAPSGAAGSTASAGGGGSTASAGTGGTAGAAATAGASGGKAGAGAAGGKAGAGGGSSAGASGAPSSEKVDFTKVAPFTVDEAARICVTLAACLPLEFPATWGPMNRCIAPSGGVFSAATPGRFTTPRIEASAFDGPLVEGYRCLLAAGADCVKAKACLTPDGAGGTCTPTAKGLDDLKCDGTRVKGCTLDGLPVEIDCARFDAVCPAGNTWCRFPACPGATTRKCVGDDVHACRVSGATITSEACTYGAQKCGLAPDGGAPECQGGTPCDDLTFKNHCEGSVRVSCSESADGVFVVRRGDCASQLVERRCDDASGCSATGTECTDATATTCAGTKLTVCQDGFAKVLDCAALGFASCSKDRCAK